MTKKYKIVIILVLLLMAYFLFFSIDSKAVKSERGLWTAVMIDQPDGPAEPNWTGFLFYNGDGDVSKVTIKTDIDGVKNEDSLEIDMCDLSLRERLSSGVFKEEGFCWMVLGNDDIKCVVLDISWEADGQVFMEKITFD